MDRGTHGSARAWYTVALLTFGYLLAMLDRTILSLMVEPIERDLAISDTQFGLLQGFTFAIFYCLAGIPIGSLIDRHSRRTIVGVGVALWSAMTMLSGAASSYLHLFLARIGVAVGEAALNPAAYSMMADLFPRERLGRAVATFSTGAMIGSGLAFLFGGALAGAVSDAGATIAVPILGEMRPWKVAFLAAGLPGIALALLMVTVVEPTRSRPRVADQTNMAALLRFLRARRLVLALHFGSFSCVTMMVYSFMTWLPATLIRVRGFSPEQTGIAMGLSSALFGLIGLLCGGALADRWVRTGRDDAHMRVGLLGMAAALPFALTAVRADTMPFVVLGMAGLFLCLSLPTAAGLAGLQLVTPPQLRGRVSALFMVVVNLAGLGFGPLGVALFTDHVFRDRLAVDRSLASMTLIVMPLAIASFSLALKPFAAAARAERLA